MMPSRSVKRPQQQAQGAPPMFYGSYPMFYDAGFAPSGAVPMTLPITGYYPAGDAPCAPLPYLPFSSGPSSAAATNLHADPWLHTRSSQNQSSQGGTTLKCSQHPTTAWGVGVPPKPSRQTNPYKGRAAAAAVDEKKAEDARTPCQFYLRTGTCAFGSRCKFFHPANQKPPQLNKEGYPVRKGEKVCAFYMRHGVCSFGATCKFHHPDRKKSKTDLAAANVTMVAMPPMAPHPMRQDYGPWPALPPQGWYAAAPPPPMVSHPPPMASIMSPAFPVQYSCYQPLSSPTEVAFFPGHAEGTCTPSLISSTTNKPYDDEDITSVSATEEYRCFSC